MSPPAKWCVVCGRRIEWRAKWARDWDAVRRCGGRCKRSRRRPDALDYALEHAVLAMATPRSAALDAVSLAHAHGADRERVRDAVRRLVVRGRVAVVRGGRVVDPSTVKGALHVKKVAVPPQPGWTRDPP